MRQTGSRNTLIRIDYDVIGQLAGIAVSFDVIQFDSRLMLLSRGLTPRQHNWTVHKTEREPEARGLLLHPPLSH